MEASLSELRGFRDGHTRARGAAAERAAREWLSGQGFEIVGANYRAGPGEIDLVAREAGTLVFLEVKARSGQGCGPALAAVPRSKQRRIARVAATFLTASGWEGPCRFDVLAIDKAGGEWRFTLVRDAFWA